MISQEEALRHSGVDVSGYTKGNYTPGEMDQIADAEKILFADWEKVCALVGRFSATVEEIPDAYEPAVILQGSWGGKRYPRFRFIID